MDTRARILLEKLLFAGQKHLAGVRSRSASLTDASLASYRKEKSLRAKEAFEDTMKAAQAEKAIDITWDRRPGYDGFIARIDLHDVKRLAKFLGKIPYEDILEDAKRNLSGFKGKYPVLLEVIDRWVLLKRVRALGPESVHDLLDAITVIERIQDTDKTTAVSLPIREMSARLFKNSKRIEALSGPLDVLLSGSIESEIRDSAAVWQELGLFREEQPVRLAGNVLVERERVIAYLDAPYAGFPADTIKRLVDIPDMILTIENQTTFHSEARKRCNERVLLVYTAGMPSPAWRAMYVRLLKGVPSNVPVYHWGDIDEGGFRIAARLAQDANTAGHTLRPWKMHPKDIPEDQKRKATVNTLDRIRYFAVSAGWQNLGEEIAAAGFTVEQEGLQ